jgi:two-component system response regulator PhoP
MRLLLVEDDPNLSRSLSVQLEQAGYSVERSMDGREGLYYAREYPVDLAIVDLGLPSLSGVELIKQLRADGKEYPILVLTARDRWQDKVEALKLGADDYVVKPFNVEELLARVDALLRRAAGWAQS